MKTISLALLLIVAPLSVAYGQGEDAVLSAILAATKDADGSVRQVAFSALTQIGHQDEAVNSAILDGLSDGEHKVRLAAFYALRELVLDPEVRTKGLIELLDDGQLSSVALQEFERVGDAALPQLLKLLEDDNKRSGAILALGRLGPAAKPATGFLLEAMKDDDPIIRARAASSLGSIWAPEKSMETGSTRARYHAYAQQLVKNHDADKDGVLSKDEWTNAQFSIDHSAVDGDKDGVVTAAEYGDFLLKSRTK